MIAKAMICSTLPLARAATGLVGTIASRVSTTEGISLVLAVASATISTPLPGWNTRPKIRPSETATAVVNRYQKIALRPMRPILAGSFSEVTPTTSDRKISGTTSILMKLMNRVPTGLTKVAFSPRSAPKTIPRTSPPAIRFHSLILDQLFHMTDVSS